MVRLVSPIARLEIPMSCFQGLRYAHYRDLTATCLVMDAVALEVLPELLEIVIDSGLFHVDQESLERMLSKCRGRLESPHHTWPNVLARNQAAPAAADTPSVTTIPFFQ